MERLVDKSPLCSDKVETPKSVSMLSTALLMDRQDLEKVQMRSSYNVLEEPISVPQRLAGVIHFTTAEQDKN